MSAALSSILRLPGPATLYGSLVPVTDQFVTATANSVRAFAWFSLAAAHGDRDAQAKLREVSQTMTPEELSQAREMAQACETSNYKQCEY